MSSFDSSPGSPGITLIIVGVILVSLIDTLATGSLVHWLPVIASVVVGLWAVAAINS